MILMGPVWGGGGGCRQKKWDENTRKHKLVSVVLARSELRRELGNASIQTVAGFPQLRTAFPRSSECVRPFPDGWVASCREQEPVKRAPLVATAAAAAAFFFSAEGRVEHPQAVLRRSRPGNRGAGRLHPYTRPRERGSQGEEAALAFRPSPPVDRLLHNQDATPPPPNSKSLFSIYSGRIAHVPPPLRAIHNTIYRGGHCPHFVGDNKDGRLCAHCLGDDMECSPTIMI